MAKRALVILASLMAAVPECRAQTDEQNCFTPTAAIYHYGNTMLSGGQKLIELDRNLKELRSSTVADEIGPTEELDAIITPLHGDTLFFHGDRYFVFNYDYWTTQKTQSLSDWGPFFKDGIDAAGRLDNTMYFFKGCKYWVGDKYEGREGRMEELDLPCDVNAAWHDDEGKLYVSKAVKFWTLDRNGVVEGPRKLADLVTLTSNVFCADK